MLELTIKAEDLKELQAKVFQLNIDLTYGPGRPHSDKNPVKEMVDTLHKMTMTIPEQELNKDVSLQSLTTPVPEFPIAQQFPVAADDIDAAGVKWNPEIHSDSKAKKADGTWRARRNGKTKEDTLTTNVVVSPEVVNNLPPVVPPVPGLSIVPSASQVMPLVEPVTPAAVVPPVLPPPVVDKFTHSYESFNKNKVRIINDLINEKKLDQEYVKSLAAHFKVTNLWEAFKDEANVKSLYDCFVEYKYITAVN